MNNLKKIILILTIFPFCGATGFAQTHRFIYELKYKTDSTSEHYEKENAVLDITGNNVQYYEYQAIEYDSINTNSPINSFSSYDFSIAKLKRELASETNKNYYLLNDTYWVFESNDAIDWKLEPDMKQVGEWKVQRATANFGGRHWTAWFANEIPFPEGPYKFNRLPGLVVEVSDSKNNYLFNLAKIEHPKNPNTNIVETLFKKKPMPISFEKYQKLLLDFYSDPYHRFRNMEEGTWSIGITDGTEVKTKEGLNKITKEKQERIRKENNPIELDKAIKYN
ncbi:MAG: GLPGLI family protein [Flavobacteriaceae bacterium]|jgi:GLPGLI family protein|nr:GLPGLI family protein [Flavobacteriaceae bacterium]